jgi:hypothetical protein
VEIEGKQLDRDKYTVSVFEEQDTVVVVLKVPDQPKGQRGHAGAIPGFEVEVRKSDGKVLRSNYLR